MKFLSLAFIPSFSMAQDVTQQNLILRNYGFDLLNTIMQNLGYTSDEAEAIAQHGCWCGKLNPSIDYQQFLGGSDPKDDLDKICKEWFDTRNCNDKLPGGSCNDGTGSLTFEYLSAGEYTISVDANGSIEDSNCSNSIDACSADTCSIDLHYISKIINYVIDPNSGFQPIYVTNDGQCSTIGNSPGSSPPNGSNSTSNTPDVVSTCTGTAPYLTVVKATQETGETDVILPDPDFDPEGWLRIETEASECLYWKPVPPKNIYYNENLEWVYKDYYGAKQNRHIDHKWGEKYLCGEQNQGSRLVNILSQQELDAMQTQIFPTFANYTWTEEWNYDVLIHVDLSRWSTSEDDWYWNREFRHSKGMDPILQDVNGGDPLFKWSKGTGPTIQPDEPRNLDAYACAVFSTHGQSEAVAGYNTPGMGYRTFPCDGTGHYGNWVHHVYFVCEKRCE